MTPEQQILYDIAKGLAALTASNLVIAIAAWLRMEKRMTRVETRLETLEIDVAEVYKERRSMPRRKES